MKCDPKKEEGIALISTLLMLSMVTFVAVAFLSLSRRERATVTVVKNITDARMMADTAKDRAISDIMSDLISQTNRFRYDIRNSRFYQRPGGFVSGEVSPTNANFSYSGGVRLDSADLLINIGNLFFDPRVPVVVDLDGDRRGDEFRHYLDFNRNGRFEWTGTFEGTNNAGAPLGYQERFFGDPQWIGVLEQPDRVHSKTNKFVGRYSYIAIPISKTLDLNTIHNNGKQISNSQEGFTRNHGVGPWEIDLAGFLAELNTNGWDRTGFDYIYETNSGFSSSGDAFRHAHLLSSHRYNSGTNTTPDYGRLATLEDVFGSAGGGLLALDHMDQLGSGDQAYGGKYYPEDGNAVDIPWFGAPKPWPYFDVQELFETNAFTEYHPFTERMEDMMDNTAHHDRYTYYRMISQIGTGTAPDIRPPSKFNLNYRNVFPEWETNLVSWTNDPIELFTLIADTLLKKRFGLSITDDRFLVPVYDPNDADSYYHQGIHQSLQLAANIYDAISGEKNPSWDYFGSYSGSERVVHEGLVYQAVGSPPANVRPYAAHASWTLIPHAPTIFRPLLHHDSTNDIVYIRSYQVETNLDFLTEQWLTLRYPSDRTLLATMTNSLAYGVPIVIGAKKGLPAFSGLDHGVSMSLTRKLEVMSDVTDTNLFVMTNLNQKLLLSANNVSKLLAWNSYTQAYPNPVRIVGQLTMNAVVKDALSNIVTEVSTWTSQNLFSDTKTFVGRDYYQKLFPINSLITNATYKTNSPFLVSVGPEDYQNPSYFPSHEFTYESTNQLYFYMFDTVTDSLIDFVSFDNIVVNINLADSVDALPPEIQEMWDMNKGQNVVDASPLQMRTNLPVAIATNIPAGVWKQIGFSAGLQIYQGEISQYWNPPDFNGVNQRNRDIAQFRRYVSLPSSVYGTPRTILSFTNEIQAGYSPTIVIRTNVALHVNDPLVHYTLDDLSLRSNPQPGFRPDEVPELWNYTNFLQETRIDPTYPFNLGYDPWGGGFQTNMLTEHQIQFDDFNPAIKDPGVRWSDDWNFPVSGLGNVGWLGRVHRGSPWQTIYMKAGVVNMNVWNDWASPWVSGLTNASVYHPTSDWSLFDMFVAYPSRAANAGVLSVNQTNYAAWSAVLSSVTVLSNKVDDAVYDWNNNRKQFWGARQFTNILIEPTSDQMRTNLNAIARVRRAKSGGVFTSVGDILSVPELTTGGNGLGLTFSPYLQIGNTLVEDLYQTPIDRVMTNYSYQQMFGLTDEAYEAIPQQIMSLLKLEDYPRYSVYFYGQALKPAPRSIYLIPGPYKGICTNYQIIGEYAAKADVRIDGVNSVVEFADTDVDIANNVIRRSGSRMAFRLEHTERFSGNIKGTQVRFTVGDTATLPDPLLNNQIYYVKDVGIDWMQFSYVPGGVAIDLLDVGVGTNGVTTVPKAVIESYTILD
ncbi:hypothetical protein N9B94_00840 [Verrucomicrobia bacterium]|nr:hypothetical protein [Verrucomicrobiota bacterium]